MLMVISISYDVNSGASSINTIISEDCDGMRLDRALAMLMPDLSRERLKALILDGKVIRQGTTAIAAPSYKVSEGEQFKITVPPPIEAQAAPQDRSEEHTSELQSLMRNSYAVFCLKKKTTTQNHKL